MPRWPPQGLQPQRDPLLPAARPPPSPHPGPGLRCLPDAAGAASFAGVPCSTWSASSPVVRPASPWSHPYARPVAHALPGTHSSLHHAARSRASSSSTTIFPPQVRSQCASQVFRKALEGEGTEMERRETNGNGQEARDGGSMAGCCTWPLTKPGETQLCSESAHC